MISGVDGRPAIGRPGPRPAPGHRADWPPDHATRELTRGWRDDPEVLPILKGLARSDERADVRGLAVLELARGWKDDPETLPLLKACAESHEDELVRHLAAQELARGWKDDPGVRTLLGHPSV